METDQNRPLPRIAAIAGAARHAYIVISAEAFVGEDAAGAIAAYAPQATTHVVTTFCDAERLLITERRVAAVLVIAPRKPLAQTRLVGLVCNRNIPLIVIAPMTTQLGQIPGRVLRSEPPFTNDTIHDVLRATDDLPD